MLVMFFFLQCSLPKHSHKTPKKVVLSLRISQTQFSPNLFPSCYLSLVVVCTPLFGTLPVCLFDDCNKIWYISKKNCAHVTVSGGGGSEKFMQKKNYSQLYVNYLFILTNASWFYRGLKLTRLLSLRAIAILHVHLKQ